MIMEHSVVHINLFMGAPTLFLFVQQATLIHPSPMFCNIWLSPIETSLWTLVTKCKQMCCPMAHLFSLYTWKLNFGQTIWDKIEVLLVLWRTSWETTWQLGEPNGNMMRTQWEQGTYLLPPLKEKIS